MKQVGDSKTKPYENQQIGQNKAHFCLFIIKNP